MLFKKLYKSYCKNLYPRIAHIRGSTWVLRQLRRSVSSFHTHIKISINNIEIKVRPKDLAHVFQSGIVDYRLKEYDLKEGDVVIDAGAFPGVFTIYAAKKVGPEGKVIAFEPIPKNFEVLKENVELNRLNNVVLVRKGLWNKEEKAKFEIKEGGSKLDTLGRSSSKEKIKAELISLDKEQKNKG